MTSRIALVEWYIERENKVTYSTDNPNGPDSYDSASALFSALTAGRFMPHVAGYRSLSLLLQYEGALLHEIKRHDIQRGDIFITGFDNDDLADNAYCGAVLDWRYIIFCNAKVNGIGREKIRFWKHQNTRWYRLAEPTQSNFKALKAERNGALYVS